YGPRSGLITTVASPVNNPSFPPQSGVVGEQALGITNQGLVLVGNTLTDGTTTVDINTVHQDGTSSYQVLPRAVSGNGEIATSDGRGMLVLNGSTQTKIPELPGAQVGSSGAIAINNQGQVIGQTWLTPTSSGSSQHSFFYSNGTSVDLSALTTDH